jgi:hypothetical protein
VLFASGIGNNPGGARLNTIGGSTAAARNIIANSDVGMEVDTGATDNLIQGNYIGTGVTGTTSYGNSTAGILVHGSRTINVNNVVSGNRVDGILVERGDETNIQGNQSASGRTFVTRMNRRSLVGPASHAPGATHVGIEAVPGGAAHRSGEQNLSPSPSPRSRK